MYKKMLKFLLGLIPQPLLWIFARPYIAGKTRQDAVNAAKKLYEDHGICSTIDMLGEDITSKSEALSVRAEVENLIDDIVDAKAADFASVRNNGTCWPPPHASSSTI